MFTVLQSPLKAFVLSPAAGKLVPCRLPLAACRLPATDSPMKSSQETRMLWAGGAARLAPRVAAAAAADEARLGGVGATDHVPRQDVWVSHKKEAPSFSSDKSPF